MTSPMPPAVMRDPQGQAPGVHIVPTPLINPDVEIPVFSKELVKVPIWAFRGGNQIDVTGFAVSLHFGPIDETATQALAGIWVPGTWEQSTVYRAVSETTYWARAMIGPGGDVALTPGDYAAWWKLTMADTSEAPARKAPGLIRILG